MIKIQTADAGEININQREVHRYLGYGKETPDSNVEAIIKKCTEEIMAVISCRACYDRFPLSFDDDLISIGNFTVKSKSLKKNLEGCNEVILFAATVGVEVDRIIHKYLSVAPSHSVVAQAVGAAVFESWCDRLCDDFKSELSAENKSLRPRFSPGYGDLELGTQKQIFAVLDCPRKIGLSLTDGMLMMPSKSVSAIVGISDN